jgi:hypothetical protein
MADHNLHADGQARKRRYFQRIPLEERFWEKVDKREPDDCWLWTATKNGNGYGQIRVNNRYQLAHRVSLHLAGRLSLDSELKACHRCDTPGCVNPGHLFLGTQRENIRDAVTKGRMQFERAADHYVRGARHGRAKLSEKEVREMFRLRSEGLLHRELAQRFGVRLGTVRSILSRRIWSHLTDLDGASK